MINQLLITQTLGPTATPGTSGELAGSHILDDGTLMRLDYVSTSVGSGPYIYYYTSYILKTIGPDGSLIAEETLVTGQVDTGEAVEAGFLFAPDGGVSVYSLSASFLVEVSAQTIGDDGTVGSPVSLATDFPLYDFRRLVARDDGEFLSVSNDFVDDARVLRFAPLKADGTADGAPAVLTGEDAFSLIGAQFIPLDDGRHILFRPADSKYNMIGTGGYPGDTREIFTMTDGVERQSNSAATAVDIGGGATALFISSYAAQDFGAPIRVLMQVIGAGGGTPAAAVEVAALSRESAVFGTRLDADGNIVMLTGTGRSEVNLLVLGTDGALLSSTTIYSATPEEAGRTVAEDVHNDFTAIFHPDGGFVLTGIRAGETRDVMFAQNFSAAGRPDGLPFDFDERAWFADQTLSLGANGDLWLQWRSALLPGSDGGITQGSSAFDIITPRVLTSGADTETLASAEAVDGGAGNDTITGSDDADRLLGAAGDDLLRAGAGDDLMRGGAGNDTLDGGDGEDTAFFQGGWAEYAIHADGDAMVLTGLGGVSGDGADVLRSVERLVFADRAVETETFETEFNAGFVGTAGDDSYQAGGGNNRLSGLGGNDILGGGDGADTLIGGDGADSLTGGDSFGDLRDLIYGGAGDDTLDGGYGNDELRGDAGNDLLLGGFGADTMIGGNDNDTLTGGAFSDVILGGDGSDYINGGFGSDRVNGGGGADRFYHLGSAGHGNDWLQDYNAAEGDILVYGGNATAAQFQVNTATTPGAGDTGIEEAFIIHRPTGQIVWALVDGAAQSTITLRLGGTDFDLLA